MAVPLLRSKHQPEITLDDVDDDRYTVTVGTDTKAIDETNKVSFDPKNAAHEYAVPYLCGNSPAMGHSHPSDVAFPVGTAGDGQQAKYGFCSRYRQRAGRQRHLILEIFLPG
jgi:hypothetical protein